MKPLVEEFKIKFLKAIEIQDKIVANSLVFTDIHKQALLSYSKSIVDTITPSTGKKNYTLTQLKSFTSEFLTFWNETVSVDCESLWMQLQENNIDFERKEPLRYALAKNRFIRVDVGISARNSWGDLRKMDSIINRYSIDEIARIDEIIKEDEKKRLAVLNSCLANKKIPNSKYLKFGECMAYFRHASYLTNIIQTLK
jgi:hypothetical protein